MALVEASERALETPGQALGFLCGPELPVTIRVWGAGNGVGDVSRGGSRAPSTFLGQWGVMVYSRTKRGHMMGQSDRTVGWALVLHARTGVRPPVFHTVP